MNAKTQSTTDAPMGAPNEKVETPDVTALTMLMHRNIERLAGLQKATLDVLNDQTAEVTETVRKSLKTTVGSPAAAFFDFAESGMAGWIGAQKNILDLIVEQSANTAQITAERSGYAAQSVGKLSELVQQTIQRTTEAQKTMLDFAAKQNDAVVKAFQRQMPGPGTGMLAQMNESTQRVVATMIDKQKEFLDAASKMSREAAAGKS